MTKLFLHSGAPSDNQLNKIYETAIEEASELYIVSAYLTDWEIKTKLNSSLTPTKFKFVFGQDFGLSRKKAIKSVLDWLPAHLKSNLRVASEIQGFHPKALFWKDADGQCYALIGSSNLTNAAFKTNYEANLLAEISAEQFKDVCTWINAIEQGSIPVSEDWLETYVEGEVSRKKPKTVQPALDNLIAALPAFKRDLILQRQEQMVKHQSIRGELKDAIKRCADQEIDNATFYRILNQLWSWEEENNGQGIGNRFQSKGWVRQGKDSDFQKLCAALQAVFQADSSNRDGVVAEQIDWLKEMGITTRGSVFSEMLCQEYPDKYPVLNQPIKDFLKDNNFSPARGSSEGSKYVDLSLKLRALIQSQSKIKNLAELDVLVQDKYRT